MYVVYFFKYKMFLRPYCIWRISYTLTSRVSRTRVYADVDAQKANCSVCIQTLLQGDTNVRSNPLKRAQTSRCELEA